MYFIFRIKYISSRQCRQATTISDVAEINNVLTNAYGFSFSDLKNTTNLVLKTKSNQPICHRFSLASFSILKDGTHSGSNQYNIHDDEHTNSQFDNNKHTSKFNGLHSHSSTVQPISKLDICLLFD